MVVSGRLGQRGETCMSMADRKAALSWAEEKDPKSEPVRRADARREKTRGDDIEALLASQAASASGGTRTWMRRGTSGRVERGARKREEGPRFGPAGVAAEPKVGGIRAKRFGAKRFGAK